MQSFYQKRFGVQLEKNEIMSMNGSQEGMTHFAWALCNPGDVVLVPNPGYPIFKIGPELCDAVTVEYPLYEKNNFLPKLENIPEETARKARFMVVSYPSNPVCSAADDCFYQELIAFAKKSIHICNLGDSRIYRQNQGNIQQLSTDHVLRSYMFGKAPLTQFLGVEESDMKLEPFIKTLEYQAGDRYLLCSDGVTDMLSDQEIEEIMA